MAEVPVQPGGTISFQAASPGGDTYVNDGATVYYAVGPASGWTITFGSQRDCEFGPHPDYSIEVPVGVTSVAERVDPFRFNDAGGRVVVTYSSAVGVVVAAVAQPIRLKDDPV